MIQCAVTNLRIYSGAIYTVLVFFKRSVAQLVNLSAKLEMILAMVNKSVVNITEDSGVITVKHAPHSKIVAILTLTWKVTYYSFT